MRELPRKLTADELAELFEGRTRFVERLSELEDPLGVAPDVIREVPEDEMLEALSARLTSAAADSLADYDWLRQ